MSPNLHATVTQYVFNLSMLQELFGMPHIDGAYWSLTIEIIFYFLVSLLISYKLMPYLNLCIAVWLGFAALPSSLHMHGSPFDVLFFPTYAPYFAAGMLFYLLQQPQGRSWLRIALLGVAYLLSVRAAINQAHLVSTVYHTTFSAGVAAGIITVFFLVFALITFRKINLSGFTWLSWLGAMTYPLYLLHSNIGFIAFHRLGGLVDKYVLLAGLLVAMLVMAYGVHMLVERRYSKPLGQKLQQLLNYLAARHAAL